jgi:dTDP-4-dehydrorhamnose reductase
MKILVFGATGQVGTEIARRGAARGHDVTALARADADLTDPASLAGAVMAHECDAIINAAAYTAVDRAEDEEAIALAINGTAPGVLAAAAADKDVPFLHVSTDYVFDGAGPHLPADPTSPANAYGRTKLVGEQLVQAAGGNASVLRTSWVFSAHGHNFVKTMLRLGAQRDELAVVGDQIGGPTWAGHIADALIAVAQRMVEGKPGEILHFSGAPDASWADFARGIFDQAGLDTRVSDIPTSTYPTPARRPLDSRMDCSSLANWGVARPDWREGLRMTLSELGVLPGEWPAPAREPR